MLEPVVAVAVPYLRRSWIPVVLVGAIMAGLAARLGALGSSSDPGALLIALFLGLLYGAALSASRWRDRLAAAHALPVSAGAALLIGGRVLPALSTIRTLPAPDLLWLMNVRMSVALEPSTPGLTRLAVCLWAWTSGAWLVWCIVRRRRAFEGLLPAAGLLMLQALRNADDTGLPLDFVICGLLLIAYCAYSTSLNVWRARRVDYPDWLGTDWLAGAAVTAMVVAGLAFASSPEFWRSVRGIIESFNASVTVSADRSPGGAPQAPLPDTGPVAARAQVPDLSLIGAPISDSDETVMWVTTDDPPPMPSQLQAPLEGPKHYWRSGIFTSYNGVGWESAEEQAILSNEPATASAPPPGRAPLAQAFELMAAGGEVRFAANVPVETDDGVSLVEVAPDGSILVQGSAAQYHVTSWVTTVTATQLNEDSTDYPPAIQEAYLQLPSSLPQRVRDLAARVVGGAETPFAKATRLQDYLRLTYPYRLDVPPVPPGSDAVDYFLFDAPGGFCSYYASAMVVMLRSQGVPARVVTGFATGEYDAERGAYRVPVSAAHAWVEVYFPSYGWVEFEPTAALTTFAYGSAAQPAEATEQPRGLVIVLPAVESLEQAAGVLVLIALAALAAFTARQRRLHRPARGDVGAQSRALYWQMRRALAAAGLPAPVSATPAEFLEAAASGLAGREHLGVAVKGITAAYVAAMYTAGPPSPDDLRTSRALWRRALRERVGLRLRWEGQEAQRRLQGGGPR